MVVELVVGEVVVSDFEVAKVVSRKRMVMGKEPDHL